MRRLEPGEVGEVKLSWKDADGRWIDRKGYHRKGQFRARVMVCDLEGERRDVRATADTPDKARARALEKARALTTVTDVVGLQADARFSDVAEGYFRHLPTTNRSASTARLYEGTIRRHVLDDPTCSLRRLSIAQANDAALLRDLLYAVDRDHGKGTAKTLRSALKGLFDYARARRAIASNEVTAIEPWRVPDGERPARATENTRDHERALTETERAELLAYADAWAKQPADPRTMRANAQGVDLLYFLAYTGVRISEALGLDWTDVDLDARSVHVRGTKSAKADRRLALPDPLVARLRARRGFGTSGLVFPSPLRPDQRWDDSNCRRIVQKVIDGAGFPWATFHTMRTTVTTILLDAGVELRRVADYMGHEDVHTTLRFYAGRSRAVDSDLAQVLAGSVQPARQEGNARVIPIDGKTAGQGSR